MAKRGNGEGSVFKTKDGRYRGFITIGYDSQGHQIKKWRRGRTQNEVIQKLNKIAAEAGSRLISRPERATVAESLKWYVQIRSKEVRPRTRENYRHYLSKLLPLLGELEIQSVRPMHVRDAYAKLAECGLSPSVRQHIHHFLAAAFREAHRMEVIERNPLASISAPRGGRVTLPKVWSHAEASAFLRAGEPDRLYPLFYLLLTVGLRIGEALALCWDDLEGDRLSIRRTLSVVQNRPTFGPPKTHRGERDLYLTEDILVVLAERKRMEELERSVASRWDDEHGLIMPTSTGTPLNPNNVRRSFRRIVKAAHVPALRIHDLRHTYITLARDAGVDVEAVANRVGQDPSITMQIYSKVTDARKRKAARSWLELGGSAK